MAYVAERLAMLTASAFNQLRSSFSIANQIEFYLRFTDLRSTWCFDRRWTVFRFPHIIDLQSRDRRFVDLPSTETTYANLVGWQWPRCK